MKYGLASTASNLRVTLYFKQHPRPASPVKGEENSFPPLEGGGKGGGCYA